jgi:hypothetical protein
MRRIIATLGAALAAALLPLPAAAACPTLPEAAGLAAAIIERRAPPAPQPGLGMADALCTRDRLVAFFAQPWGDEVGWKVGLTNPAAQQRFGTTGPVRRANLPRHAARAVRRGDPRPPSGSTRRSRATCWCASATRA